MLKQVKWPLLAFTLVTAVCSYMAFSTSALAYSCESTMNGPDGGECSETAFDQKLVGQESGNNYGAQAPNSSAAGRYQFIDSTRATIGKKYGLPLSGKGDREAFRNCPGVQDQYYRALIQENLQLTSSACSQYCGQTRDGVEITRSGLVAMAHNVGAGCANAFARGGYAAMERITKPPRCRDANGTDPVAKYMAPMGGFDIGGYAGPGECGKGVENPDPTPYQGGFDQAGCNPALLNAMKSKQQALQQHETEAAKALITKPTSVQQLTCFDQYTKLNSEKIGKIHSDPAQGISDSIVPMVEVPNIQNLTKNFLSGIMGGGLQSMLSNAISSLGLGSLTGGGSSGNCPMMDQMWDLLQCIDFPQMPSLNDILGGKGGKLGGILSGLGDLASGKGIMGQVCSAAKDLMGGGGSGGSSVYQNAIDAMSRGYESFDDDGDNDDEQNACDYRSIARTVTDMRADLNGNNVIEASELTLIDLDQNCEISDTEIDAYLQTRSNL